MRIIYTITCLLFASILIAQQPNLLERITLENNNLFSIYNPKGFVRYKDSIFFLAQDGTFNNAFQFFKADTKTNGIRKIPISLKNGQIIDRLAIGQSSEANDSTIVFILKRPQGTTDTIFELHNYFKSKDNLIFYNLSILKDTVVGFTNEPTLKALYGDLGTLKNVKNLKDLKTNLPNNKITFELDWQKTLNNRLIKTTTYTKLDGNDGISWQELLLRDSVDILEDGTATATDFGFFFLKGRRSKLSDQAIARRERQENIKFRNDSGQPSQYATPISDITIDIIDLGAYGSTLFYIENYSNGTGFLKKDVDNNTTQQAITILSNTISEINTDISGVTIGNFVYFRSYKGKLWRIDGNNALNLQQNGLSKLSDNASANNLTAIGNKLFFTDSSVLTAPNGGIYDASSSPPKLIHKFNPNEQFYKIINVNGQAYSLVSKADKTFLYRLDSDKAVLAADVSGIALEFGYTVLGNYLFFTAWSPIASGFVPFRVNIKNPLPCDNDVTAPTASSLNNISESFKAVNVSKKKVQWQEPNVTENCSFYTISNTSFPTTSLVNGSDFPIGKTTITYTVTDSKGLKSTPRSFDIELINPCWNDVLKPVKLSCPLDITRVISTDSAKITWDKPSFSDECGVRSIDSISGSGRFFKVGTTLISYTAVDSLNNKSDACSFKVIIQKLSKTIDNDPTLSPMRIFTNNTEGVVTIDFESLTARNMTFRFYDIAGRLLKEDNKRIEAGHNDLNFIIKNLQSGVYLISPSTNNNLHSSLRFIKI